MSLDLEAPDLLQGSRRQFVDDGDGVVEIGSVSLPGILENTEGARFLGEARGTDQECRRQNRPEDLRKPRTGSRQTVSLAPPSRIPD